MTLILAATASPELAKDLAEAHVDRIVAYHSSAYRQRGLPSVAGLLPWASANQQTLDMLPGVLAGANQCHVLATVCANDALLTRDLMLDALQHLGVHGVLNAPTTGLLSGAIREVLDAEGLGIHAEMALIAQARRRGMEAWAYVFDQEWAQAALNEDATGLIVHLGITGHPSPGSPASAVVERVLEVSRGSVPVLLHGGPLRSPADLTHLLADLPPASNSHISGIFGASVFEGPTDRSDCSRSTAERIEAWRAALNERQTP